LERPDIRVGSAYFDLVLHCLPDSKTNDHPTEKRHKFTSMVEAMNYLSADGWQFVQAYAESYGQWSFIHWILRKKK